MQRNIHTQRHNTHTHTDRGSIYNFLPSEVPYKSVKKNVGHEIAFMLKNNETYVFFPNPPCIDP